MNSLIDLFQQPLFHRVGWVLVHFLWEGAGIGLLLAVVLRLINNASSHLRYFVICVALLACGIAPAITWAALAREAATRVSQQAGGNLEAPTTFISQKPPIENARTAQARPSTAEAATGSAGSSAWQGNYLQILDHLLPYAVALWFAGVLILTLRLALGWMQVLRIRWSGTALPDPAWHERFRLLAERMRVSASVWLFKSALVEVPTLIGWLRPVILLPASAFTGLTPAQLEAVLAHELAHVMRYDYVVNFLQTTIEAILFYHPAVWWIGRKLREERENCCDDIVVETTRDRATYASALATLEESRAFSPALALAASDGMLLARIRRIVGVDRGKSSFLPVIATVLIVGSLLAPLGSRLASGQGSILKPKKSETLEPATKENPFENSLGMKFVPVPGTGVLFSIWDTRVQDYRAYAEANSGVDAGWKRPGFKQGEDHPVVNVCWNDAKAFCAWLTKKDRQEGKIREDEEYRLPTDEEWSAAVGAGKYPWGNDWPPPRGAGNYNPSIKVDDYANTSPVGSFGANQYGLYDMGGNVWQWCEDWYRGDMNEQAFLDVFPFLKDDGGGEKYRVIRGSGWGDGDPVRVWSSDRNRNAPDYRDNPFGFRCVLALKDSKASITDRKRAAKLDGSHDADAVSAANYDGLNLAEGATKDNPFENSLGMKFVPVPGTGVLFSIWDTRVGDFRMYARETGYVQSGGIWKMKIVKTDKGGYSLAGELGENATWENPGFKQGEDHPVVGVDWNEAKAFCAWLTEKERKAGRIGREQEYRLPTYKEWDAAVGKSKYPWGNAWPPPEGAGNYADDAFVMATLPGKGLAQIPVNDGYAWTSPVGHFKANLLGLYDMSGNVWQWCEDLYRDDATAQKDDGGQDIRSSRGGSWQVQELSPLLSTARYDLNIACRDGNIGFRCVLVLKLHATSADNKRAAELDAH